MNSEAFFFLYILPLITGAGVWFAIWVSDINLARRQKNHSSE